ncbi:hypothetical protein [Lysobacter tyrosinilyticus]
MFGRWFQRALSIDKRVEDRVWTDAAACDRGLRAQVAQALSARNAVLVLTRSLTEREDLARDLSTRVLRVGGDRFAAADLQQHLRSPAALGLACIGDLRATAASTGQTAPLQVHIRGRGTRRSEDRALLDLLAPWAPAQVVFHHAIDDPLLQSHTATLQPLLEKLGWRPDEPIAGPLLTRAIARAQRP